MMMMKGERKIGINDYDDMRAHGGVSSDEIEKSGIQEFMGQGKEYSVSQRDWFII